MWSELISGDELISVVGFWLTQIDQKIIALNICYFLLFPLFGKGSCANHNHHSFTTQFVNNEYYALN